MALSIDNNVDTTTMDSDNNVDLQGGPNEGQQSFPEVEEQQTQNNVEDGSITAGVEESGIRSNTATSRPRTVHTLRNPLFWKVVFHSLFESFYRGMLYWSLMWIITYPLDIVFYLVDGGLRSEVAKRDKKNKKTLMGLLFALTVFFVWIFEFALDWRMLNSLLFLPPSFQVIDSQLLVVVTLTTDYVVKLLTVYLKILMTFVPSTYLEIGKRGKLFSFVEYSSQLYRSLLPIPPWLTYLSIPFSYTNQSFNGQQFGYLVVTIYLSCKLWFDIRTRFLKWWRAVHVLRGKQSNPGFLGSPPLNNVVYGDGQTCAVCFEEFTDPTTLQCSHVFCEQCIISWFSSQDVKTCPICRVEVQYDDKPAYRNGETLEAILLV